MATMVTTTLPVIPNGDFHFELDSRITDPAA